MTGRRARPAAVLALAGAAAALAVWALLLSGPRRADLPVSVPAAPIDRPVPGAPLRLAVMGTSLTARYDWPAALAARLETCLARPVATTVIARSGRTVAWGAGRTGALLAARPDVVLIEFTANDADPRRRLTPARADALLGEILAALQADRPGARVLLMGMNPSFGLRGLLRLREPRYLADYVARAQGDERIGYIDLAPDWMSRIAADGRNSVLPDGLHPDPDAARAVIPARLAPDIARLFGRACP